MIRQLCIILLLLLFARQSFAQDRAAYPRALPDLRISKGTRAIAEAWLSHPTDRYKHFVLGSTYEAQQLNIRLRNDRILKYRLNKQSVFEDRLARLYDLDGDGEQEIIVVRAYMSGGAALSVFSIKTGRLELLAETPDMGHAFGWLNPAGIADFDGDGKIEIAFVRKPHVMGQLELWEYADGKLTKEHQTSDTSNHSIGSPYLGLSAVADFNNDGTPDLALPSMSKTTLRFFSFKNGVREIKKVRLLGFVTEDISIKMQDGKTGLVIPTSNGKQFLPF